MNTLQWTVAYFSGTVTLNVTIMPGTGDFEICEGEALLVTGVVSTPEGPFLDRDQYSTANNITSKMESTEYNLTSAEVYKELRLRGYDYGTTFQGIVEASQTGNNIVQLYFSKCII